MRLSTYEIDTNSEYYADYLPRLRDYSRTQLEYEGGLPEYEDLADHYVQSAQARRLNNAL